MGSALGHARLDLGSVQVSHDGDSSALCSGSVGLSRPYGARPGPLQRSDGILRIGLDMNATPADTTLEPREGPIRACPEYRNAVVATALGLTSRDARRRQEGAGWTP